MESFTYRQKTAAFRAFQRGWVKALEDEEEWRIMDSRERTRFLKAKVWEEILSLPTRKSWWAWLTGG